MVDGVKSGRKIKEAKTRQLLSSHESEAQIYNGMIHSVWTRLKQQGVVPALHVLIIRMPHVA